MQADRLAKQLDWNLLRTYMVIVQEGSITGAAQRLNVTQPSISSALRRLEDRLEHRLIERGSGHTFSVTQAGEAVYREALEIYGGILRLKDLSSKADKAISGNIIIYRSSHLDMTFLDPLLSRYRRMHPGVTFALRSTSCHGVNQALLQRECTLGFCSRLNPSPRLSSRSLTAQEFGFFCGPKHPLYGVTEPDSVALSNSDVVGFEEDHMAGALSPITIHRVRHGIGGNLVAVASGALDLLNLIRHYETIGAYPRSLAETHGIDLWELPLSGGRPRIDVFAAVDSDRHLTPAERSFLDFLEAEGVATCPKRQGIS